MEGQVAKFSLGHVVHHRKHNYRGAVIDVDPQYMGSEESYEEMAQSGPHKEQPWYHVLVDDTDHMTYVAEQNLEEDGTGQPITHPALPLFLTEVDGGQYASQQTLN